MMLDKQNMFSEAQSITTATTQNSTNTVDGSVAINLGSGEPLRAFFQVTTSVMTGTAGTIRAQLISSAAANLGSPTILVDTGVITCPAVGVSAKYEMLVPASAQTAFGANTKRYYGMSYISTVGTTLTLLVTSGFDIDGQTTWSS